MKTNTNSVDVVNDFEFASFAVKWNWIVYNASVKWARNSPGHVKRRRREEEEEEEEEEGCMEEKSKRIKVVRTRRKPEGWTGLFKWGSFEETEEEEEGVKKGDFSFLLSLLFSLRQRCERLEKAR